MTQGHAFEAGSFAEHGHAVSLTDGGAAGAGPPVAAPVVCWLPSVSGRVAWFPVVCAGVFSADAGAEVA